MSTVTTEVPTRPAIEADIQAAEARLRQLDAVHDFTIIDYPIGSRNRGQCRLEVEFKKGKGWRTKRTTTNKHGDWCKPKCSTYDLLPIVIVTGNFERGVAWLRCGSYGDQGLYLQVANGEVVETILRKPEGIPFSAPRRKPEMHTIHTQRFSCTSATRGVGEPVAEEKVTHPADPPEVCDAWDVWEEGIKHLFRIVAEMGKEVA